jgi:hypothetical protein
MIDPVAHRLMHTQFCTASSHDCARVPLLCWIDDESDDGVVWTAIGTIGRYRLIRKDQLQRIGLHDG